MLVRHPCAGQGPFAAIATGAPARRRPLDRAGPSAPKTGDYVDRDALHHGSCPQTPADPYRPRTLRSRSARVPKSVGRRRRRMGGVFGAIRLCLRSFGTGSLVWRPRESSTPASGRQALMPPLPREAFERDAKYFCPRPWAGESKIRREPLARHPGGVRWRRGEGLRPGSVAPEGAILLQVVYFGLHVQTQSRGRDFRPCLHRSVQATRLSKSLRLAIEADQWRIRLLTFWRRPGRKD
jgi:hypothetical protein